MTLDPQALRLDGIYPQNREGDLMLRVKIPAGVLSCEQAEKLAAIASRFARGRLHLTCRGSVELHWLRVEQLAQVMPMLAAVGLTSRGACGGAVRGISCSTTFGPGFEQVQGIARALHRHFAGNPHFEGLPKKFKIAVEAGYAGARHLIQDLALVLVEAGDKDEPRFDIWCGGGLGREPEPAFCYARGLAEQELIPLIEAVVRVYAAHTPAGKRLKHLRRELGDEALRDRVEELRRRGPAPELRPSTAGLLIPAPGEVVRVPVFAGEVAADALLRVAELAREHCGGFFALSADQDFSLPVPPDTDAALLRAALQDAGLLSAPAPPRFRICPGSHECRMGLAATRDLSQRLLPLLPLDGAEQTFAISGCPNSCSQPQLADLGIVTASATREHDGSRTPRFDLFRRSGDGFGQVVHSNLKEDELVDTVLASMPRTSVQPQSGRLKEPL